MMMQGLQVTGAPSSKMFFLRLQDAWRPPLTVLFLSAALGASLFFQGKGLTPLSLCLTFLVAAGVVALWTPSAVSVPKSPVAGLLSLFWLWLALSLLGSVVPAVSIVDFWWLSALPLSFWIATSAGDLGRLGPRVLVLGALCCVALAGLALYQAFVEHTIPESLFLNTNSQDALFNLIILPALALMPASRARGDWRLNWMAASVAAVLIFTTGVTEERGPVIALLLGFALFWGVARHALPRGSGWRALLLMALALAAANLARRGHTAGRLVTVAHPVSALATRVVIWKGAWRLAAHVPWHGLGLGLFGLAFPPYRGLTDSSAGFFAHNDYLQIYIEAGWPALLLLLGLLTSIVWLFRQTLARWAPEDRRRIPAAALFAALLATAAHSLVDFDFYIPSILILMGVELAWLHQLLWEQRPVMQPLARIGFSPEGYRALLGALALLPVAYFLAIAVGDYDYKAALRAGNRGDWVAAEQQLLRAQKLFPDSEPIRTTRGDLARLLLRYLPHHRGLARARVYAEARHDLRQAHRLDPLRPQSLRLLGELEEEHPGLAGAHAQTRALKHFEAALALDPRNFKARFDAVELLLHQHHLRLASQIAEAGIHYWYAPAPAVLPYLGLTAALRHQRGDSAGAARLAARVRAIEQSFPLSQRSRRTQILGTSSLRGWDAP